MMSTIRPRLLMTTLVLLGFAYAPALLAESDAEQSAPSAQSAPSESSPLSYSDRELQSFAVAVLEVERIKSSYAPKLAQNLREQAQVKQAASMELLTALKQHGMSVDKYQEMLAKVQSDPQLADKVNGYLKSAPDNGSVQGSNSNGGQQSAPKTPAAPDAAGKVEEL